MALSHPAGHFGDVLAADLFDDIEQELHEELRMAFREVEVDCLVGHRVALGGSAGPGPVPSVGSAAGHLEIAVFDQMVEMVASHVGVDVEQLGNLGGGERFG